MKIPLCVPSVGGEELNLIKEVLDSGWLAHGPKTKEFEDAFAKYIGVKKAVSVNSCTSALQLAIIAKELKGEIIVPSFTFMASANAIVTSGCKPVFVDIDEKTCNIDPKKIEEKITNKIAAIMPVHFAGQPCNMKEIMEIAEKHNLVVIEDSAECIGGTFDNKKAGSFGIGCFSFYPTKNMTTGEGGMITTDDEQLAEKVAALKAHGILTSTFEREKIKKPWLRAATYAGYNFRLCDVLSAIGIVQLKKLDKMNELRRKHAAYLNSKLKDIKGIEIPFEANKCMHVYQMYTIKLKDKGKRDEFAAKLRERGIGASVHFDPPVHKQQFYKGNYTLPVTEKVSESIITLPMYPGLTKEQLIYMVDAIKNVIG